VTFKGTDPHGYTRNMHKTLQKCLKFDDAKGVIRSRTDNTIVTKKYKGTKNNLQNTTQKTNDRSTRIPTRSRGRGVISGAPKG